MKINKIKRAERVSSYIKVMLIICVLLFSSCAFLNQPGEGEDTGTSGTGADVRPGGERAAEEAGTIPDLQEIPRIGDKAPVSRALAAKMLTLAFNGLNDIRSAQREISFSDTDISKWYDKFINTAYAQKIMSGAGDKFFPEEALTLEHAQMILGNIAPGNKIRLDMTGKDKNDPISYALWVQMYIKFLETQADGKSLYEAFGVTRSDTVILATPASNGLLTGFNLITDMGPATFSGLYMDSYIDKQVRVLAKDTEIIAVLGVVSETPLIKSCYITDAGGGTVTVFTGGAERSFSYGGASDKWAGKICDITINGNTAENIVVYEETVTDDCMLFDGEIFEFRENGIIETGDALKVYSVSDGAVKWKGARDIIAGTGRDSAVFFIRDNKVCAAVINKKPEAGVIRVALNNTGFTSLYHDGVVLSADTDFTVRYTGGETRYKKGEDLRVPPVRTGISRLYVSPDSPGGRIEIKSIKRGQAQGGFPKYRGVVEICFMPGGKITLVNEVSVEEYLYGVVPSEMPQSHGALAAQVQAITARSYAYNQFYANRYHKYGGNVDDSVSCQVYNNIPENDISIQAVDATRGQCLTFSGSVVSANFFSTSAGVTANSGEVWANSASGQFPARTESYLESVKQYQNADFGDLSREDAADEFFKATDIESFDSSYSWFRWNTVMDAAEITRSVNGNIKSRYESSPKLIKTLQPNGAYLVRPVESVGDVYDLEVIKRGVGGNIMELKITGSEAVVCVLTEYNIRALLRPPLINLADGSSVRDFGMMPSAFFTMDREYNGDGSLSGAAFHGGGYGHGVGMSQNGVKAMADAGYQANEILSHYYKGCEIKEMF